MISRFADSRACRHRQICLHFGETPQWESCGSCDNCGTKPEWLKKEKVSVLPEVAARGTSRSSPRNYTPMLGSDKPRVRDSAPAEANPALAEYLREWRRTMARENKVPAYVVLHDSTLEELCRRRPANFPALKQVPGIGEKKADVYGAEILQILQNFDDGARAAPMVAKESTPAEQTLRLLNEGRSFEEIGRIRARQVSTIVCTVASLIETGQVELDPKWISPDAQPLIEAACLTQGVERLKDIKDAVPPYVSFEDIRLVVAHMRAENRVRARTA